MFGSFGFNGFGFGLRSGGVSGGGPAPLLPVTTTSTVNYLGQTMTLSSPMKVGYLGNGQPVIISDQSGGVASFSTPSTVVGGYDAHGAEFMPWWIGSGRSQGIAGALAAQSGGSGIQPYGTIFAYDPAKNVDPGKTGAPFAITPGMCGRLVKCIQRSNYVVGEFCLPEKLLHINIVPSIPPADAQQVIFNGDGTASYLTTAQNRKEVFRGNGYIASQTTLAACISGGYMPATDWPFYIDDGEWRRGVIPYSTLWTTGYSRDFGGRLSEVLNACHSEGAGGISDAVMRYLMTQGALLIENVRRGNVQRGGAGQNNGMKPLAALAGMASNDAAILAQSYLYEGNETHQQFVVTSEFLGVAGGWPNGAGADYQFRPTFLPEHLGRGQFFHGEQPVPPDPNVKTELFDSRYAVRYQFVSSQGGGLGVAAMAQYQNGPGGIDGGSYFLRGGSADRSTNPYAGTLTYWQEMLTANADSSNASPFSLAWHRDILAKALGYTTPLPQAPAAFSPQRNVANYMQATADGFTWDWRNVGWFTETPNRWDHRYTLDGGRSFLQDYNVANTGTKTGFPRGVDVGVQLRRWSATKGAGPWSVNTPRSTADAGDLSTVTPFVIQATGTPTGTPTNVQAPQIGYKPYPASGFPYYIPFTGEAPINQPLSGGVGWWTGNLVSPGRLVKWRRGLSTDISGATGLDYTVTSADAGQNLYFGVSYDGGTTYVWSSPVAVAAPVYPAKSQVLFPTTADLRRASVLAGSPATVNSLTIIMMVQLMQDHTDLRRLLALGDATAGTATSNNLLMLDRLATGQLSLARGSTNLATAQNVDDGKLMIADNELRVIVHLNFAGSSLQWYMNDTAVPTTGAPVMGASTFALGSVARQFIFSALSGAAKPNIRHRYTFIDYNKSIDFSLQSNRDKTLLANIGDRGQNVFGSDPLAFLYGPVATLGANYGTGGDFAINGTGAVDVP